MFFILQNYSVSNFQLIHKYIQNSNLLDIFIRKLLVRVIFYEKAKNLILTLWPILSDRFLGQKIQEKNTTMHIKYDYYFILLCLNVNGFFIENILLSILLSSHCFTILQKSTSYMPCKASSNLSNNISKTCLQT